MPVYKDNKNGTWYVSLWFTAWDGSKKKKLKRGFATKHEAAEYERKLYILISSAATVRCE